MLEAYQAYADYNVMADLTRQLVQTAAEALTGTHVVRYVDGTEFDLGGDWRTVTLYGALSEALGEEVTVDSPHGRLAALAGKHDVGVDPSWGPGKTAEEVFEALVVPG